MAIDFDIQLELNILKEQNNFIRTIMQQYKLIQPGNAAKNKTFSKIRKTRKEFPDSNYF